MTKKKNQVIDNNKKKRKIKVDYLRVILIIVLVYFSITFVRQQFSINEYNVKLKSVKEDIQDTKAKIDELKDIETKVDDSEYIEKVAREELGYVKPYEKIFIDVNK